MLRNIVPQRLYPPRSVRRVNCEKTLKSGPLYADKGSEKMRARPRVDKRRTQC